MVGTNKTNFPHNLLLTDKQVSSLCKTFANDLSVNKNIKNLTVQNNKIRRISW